MSSVARRPKAVAFDVNETLFDISMLEEAFLDFGMPEYAVHWWFATVLRDGMALSASGDAAPFGMIAGAALEELFSTLNKYPPTGAASTLLETFAKLRAHPDVRPALEMLEQEEIPAIALTNGNANVTKGLFEKSGLSSLIAHVLSVDDVAHWKPRREPYRYAAEKLGLTSSSIAMVAVHPWDTHGAKRAGMITGWVNRSNRNYPSFFTSPDVEAPTADGVVRLLLRRG